MQARNSGWWWIAGVAAVVVALGNTTFGAWTQSFPGTGVRWQEAYKALQTAESNLPRNSRERERLLLATAHADGEPPLGLPIGPRLHKTGTLARLQYETFDENGGRLDDWQVRALVPTIGGEPGWGWREECPPACFEELTRTQGLRITHSGAPGIAEEWVLRMPVGQTFELTPTPLQTHDILDGQPRRLPLRFVRVGSQSVQRPAKMRVTLVEACPATVRVGTVTKLEFFPHATIPIPRGFRELHWVQLDGCGQLAPFPAPPAEERPAPVKRTIPAPPDLQAIVAHRDSRTGHSALRVDETWLMRHGTPVAFQVDTICRFVAASNQWQRLPAPDRRVSWRLEPQTEESARAGDRVAFEAPRETGLFWVKWSEQQVDNKSARSVLLRDALMVSGPVLCNDVHLGLAPAGHVAACVPFADRAEARFVQQPADVCQK